MATTLEPVYINETIVCHQWLVATEICHRVTTIQSLSTTFELVIQTHQLVSFKKKELTGMSNLPFSSHCRAHFDRLHLFWCSTSEISSSWYPQRTFWKCRISKHRCFY